MNSKIKKAAVLVLALLLVAFLFGGPSEARNSNKRCSVVNLKVTEEPFSRPGETRVLSYRWVRVETIRCGKRFLDITTYGEWQRKTPFYS